MLNYYCQTDKRRNAIKKHSFLNGIDYLEVSDAGQDILLLHLLNPGKLDPSQIVIKGGERIQNIRIVAIQPATLDTSDDPNASVWEIQVSDAGDFSTYTLCLVKGQEFIESGEAPPGFDPVLSRVDFSFKVNCPKDFDCAPTPLSFPGAAETPPINYLAKDYATFRQLMLDRINLLVPGWRESNPADIGIMLVELLAYAADYLSYKQDAVATEAYLNTARKRISVRRHARLVDYHMHDGCNARTWVQIRVKADQSTLALNRSMGSQRTQLLSRTDGLPSVVSPTSQDYRQAIRNGAHVFELMQDVRLYPEHNVMPFHAWGGTDCCLREGATGAVLSGHYPNLKAGDILIFMEVLGPHSGLPQDADPAKRHAVRLVRVSPDHDVDLEALADDENSPDPSVDLFTLPVTRIEWDVLDALPFSLCLTYEGREGISIALGNIVLADHGMTVFDQEQSSLKPDRVPYPGLRYAGKTADRLIPQRYYPQLLYTPLTQAVPMDLAENGTLQISAGEVMKWSVADALPAIHLREAAEPENKWTAKRDLLIDSAASDRHFIVEIEKDGTAYLRFGNDKNGARPDPDTVFRATYRLGNGPDGNIGAGTLAHLVTEDASLLAGIEGIGGIYHPLPARGGTAPESMEEVRQFAPQAFRTQERAVTTTDYEDFAKKCRTDLQRAAATFRWTGSWKTAFITADRFGGLEIDEAFDQDLRSCLETYRMAGFDLRIDAPVYVSLEVEMEVQVNVNFFTNDVKQDLLLRFSNQILPDGRRGIFHPDNFSFGQSVYRSRLYAAAQEVNGVDAVKITKFRRQSDPAGDLADSGELRFGRREIARLDNDPNFPERGRFHLMLRGGRL